MDIDCYYNVNLFDKRPPPLIQCTINYILLLFGLSNGGSCVYDINDTFDAEILDFIINSVNFYW